MGGLNVGVGDDVRGGLEWLDARVDSPSIVCTKKCYVRFAEKLVMGVTVRMNCLIGKKLDNATPATWYSWKRWKKQDVQIGKECGG